MTLLKAKYTYAQNLERFIYMNFSLPTIFPNYTVEHKYNVCAHLQSLSSSLTLYILLL